MKILSAVERAQAKERLHRGEPELVVLDYDESGNEVVGYVRPEVLSCIPQCVCTHLITHHQPRAFPPRLCEITGCECTGYEEQK